MGAAPPVRVAAVKPAAKQLVWALALAVVCAATAAAKPTCTPGSKLNPQQQLLARYIYELRNNRQTDCSPPDFVQNATQQGFAVTRLCTEPGALPTDTYTNLTATFKDTCRDGDPETKLSVETLVRQCAGQDPTLQPWAADSVVAAVEPLPANFTCPAGLQPIPFVDDEIDFTTMWEFNHLCENSMKYKLFPSDPTAVPQCGGGAAWLTTTMQSACYSPTSGQYDGYCNILFTCADGVEHNVSVHAAATLLPGGRQACPWPMFLPGSDGYDPAFNFLANQTTPPAPGPSPADLAACLAAAGVDFVDGSTPLELDKASKVWNKLNDTTPAAVAYPADEKQVAAAVLCAKAAGVKPVPRCGGHSYQGYSVMPEGLTIDLGRMNATTVAPDGATATVQGGARLGQVYYTVYNETSGAKGVVGGTCPTVGTGGHFQGGGIGPLTRQHGLACDQVTEVQLVDAQGRLVVANASHNPDVLAAACGGGGGNLGVITQYTIKIHDVPPVFTIVGWTVGPAQALEFLNFVQSEWVPTGSSKLWMQLNIDIDGVDVSCQYPGPWSELEPLLADEGLLGNGTGWNVTGLNWQEMDWINTVIQQAYWPTVKTPQDLLNVESMELLYRDYFKLKSFFAVEPLPDAAWEQMIYWQAAIDKYGGYIELDIWGGAPSAVAAVPSNATGFVHREALFTIQYGAEWQREVTTNKVIPLIEQMQSALDPFFDPTRPAYINYLDVQVGSDPLESYYGVNLGWLQDVKTRLDPHNLFTANPLAIPALNGSHAPSPAPAPASPGPAPAPDSPSPAPAPAPVPSSGGSSPAQGLLAAALSLLLTLLW